MDRSSRNNLTPDGLVDRDNDNILTVEERDNGNVLIQITQNNLGVHCVLGVYVNHGIDLDWVIQSLTTIRDKKKTSAK